METATNGSPESALVARSGPSRPAPRACCNTGNRKAGPCKQEGAKACKNCRLVLYCSASCQESHWNEHKKDCKSAFVKDTWRPKWFWERRDPSFISYNDGVVQVPHGANKYLWGNVPAVDIVKLKDNEGVHHGEALDILFAASGDLRNALLSVAALPETYRSPLTVVLNDLDFDVTARNAIVLLIFVAASSADEAAQHVIHLLYSALITGDTYVFLQHKVKPLVEDVLAKIVHKSAGALLAKTWTTPMDYSLRIELPKDKWVELHRYLTVPDGLNKSAAQKVRCAVMLAPHRLDRSDRFLLLQLPEHRSSFAKFRSDGLLLPFGHPRAAFDTPNPTFFQNKDEWPMMDSADPMMGWDMNAVRATDAGLAKNDLYGKLHEHISGVLRAFYHQLGKRSTAFRLHTVDVRQLPSHLAGMRFDRIDASNIADRAYVGTPTTLEILAPLLRPRNTNPSATLITMYLNAVYEASMLAGGHHEGIGDVVAAAKYMEIARPRSGDELKLLAIKAIGAAKLLQDMDRLFDMYARLENFDTVGLGAGVQQRAKNRVVEPWPMRFRGGPATPETRREFQRLFSSSHPGSERYVEWEPIGEVTAEELD